MKLPAASKISSQYIIYLLKFGAFFCVLYFGSLAVIGLSTPENSYSAFVDHYLDYISPLRTGLLVGAQSFLDIAGHSTVFLDEYTLVFANNENSGVRMVYSCIGYGVLSFWAAFVLANAGTIRYKTSWLVSGCLALCFLNVMRIFWLMLSIRNSWPVPFGLDHHTVFNIAAYALIFFMIYWYDRQATRKLKQTSTQHVYRPVEVQ